MVMALTLAKKIVEWKPIALRISKRPKMKWGRECKA
jgi:hypothetical protein